MISEKTDKIFIKEKQDILDSINNYFKTKEQSLSTPEVKDKVVVSNEVRDVKNMSIEELEKEGFDINEYTNAAKELKDYEKTIDKFSPYKTKKQIELEDKIDAAADNVRKKGNEWANKKISSSKSVIAIPEFMTPKEFYAIKTFADIQKWQDKFNDLLNNPVTAKKYNLTAQYVDNKINEFKLLIAERVVFEDLTEGVVILDMNNEQKIVTKKNDNQVIITNLDESGAPVLETSTPITKAEIKQKIKYIYRQGMEDIDLSIKLTEEQIVISNENVKNAIDMSIKEKTDSAVNFAKKLTLEERRKKLKDGLGC